MAGNRHHLLLEVTPQLRTRPHRADGLLHCLHCRAAELHRKVKSRRI